MDNGLKNKKVFVGKYSKEIQEKAFELGFKWKYSGSTEVSKNFDVPFLYFEESGEMGGVDSLNIFYNESCDFEEVSTEYILSLKVKTKPQWEDFGEMKGCYVGDLSEIETILKCKSTSVNKNLFPTKEEAEACIALSQLCQWRDKYNDGWKPDWTDYDSLKYIIEYHEDNIDVATHTHIQRVLAFKSPEIRDKFLNDFKDLIEQAKPLL